MWPVQELLLAKVGITFTTRLHIQMTIIDRPLRITAILTLAGLASCASNPPPGPLCGVTPSPTSGWPTYDEGAFTVSLPPEYERVQTQGIDSQVGRWEAAGKEVTYDYGFYSNPLEQNEVTPMPGFTLCQDSDDSGAPRIIQHRPAEGGYAISAHWPDLHETESGMTESLTLGGVVQQAEDLGELLAIIQSVQIRVR